MNVVWCGSGWMVMVDILRERLAGEVDVIVWDREQPLVEVLAGADVIMPSNGRVDAAAIAAPKNLRLVQQPAAGIDGIDLDAARARGVPVCNAPGANHASVAETALFLMLALARRYKTAALAFGRAEIGTPVGVELRGKRLGIIGMGRSGRALAEAAGGLGMEILGATSQSSAEELDRLFAAADVVSLHCPLDERTEGMVDARRLALMKPGALLVNCARGPIVDRAALEAALLRGHLGGVGLDTPWSEPWDPSDPLFNRENVITLPHVAGSSEESFARIADIVVDNIRRVGRGDEPLHRVV